MHVKPSSATKAIYAEFGYPLITVYKADISNEESHRDKK